MCGERGELIASGPAKGRTMTDEMRVDPVLQTYVDAVANGDRVELHRRAAGFANPFLHLGREPPQVKVAGHGFDPGVRYSDQRPREVGIREPNRLEHGASARPIAPFSNATTDMFEIHSSRDYKTQGERTKLL